MARHQHRGQPATSTPETKPFRDDETRLQRAALREQRDALLKQRNAHRAELRHLLRWRWAPFLAAYFVAVIGIPLLLWTLMALLSR